MPLDWGLDNNERTNRKQFSQAERDKVWRKQFKTAYEGICPICKEHPILRLNFEMGHKISLFNGGDNELTNIKPICQRCNRQMGKMDIKVYKDTYWPPEKTKKAPKKRKEDEDNKDDRDQLAHLWKI